MSTEQGDTDPIRLRMSCSTARQIGRSRSDRQSSLSVLARRDRRTRARGIDCLPARVGGAVIYREGGCSE
jgi:hypothetical protein